MSASLRVEYNLQQYFTVFLAELGTRSLEPSIFSGAGPGAGVFLNISLEAEQELGNKNFISSSSKVGHGKF